MQKKYWLYLLVCFGLHVQNTLGQTTSCAQTLRLARSTYDQGRLHELPELLKSCLTNVNNGFTKQEKVEAYKLLALAFTYLEEPEKADEAMLNLLRTDNYFEINEGVDPAEFVALYRTFRTKPIFGIAIKLGPNMTLPSVIDNYYVGNSAAGTGKYGQRIGFNFGLSFEKDLFISSPSKFLTKLTIAPELQYVTRSFDYTAPSVFLDDKTNTSVASSLSIYKQTWIDLNAIVHYKLSDWAINPYVGVGPGVSYLLNASNQLTLIPLSGSTVSGPNVDVKNSYNKVVYNVIGLAGIKVKAASFYLTAEVRFQYGLMNVINSAKRTNAESVFDYATQFNNFRQSTASVNIGIIRPIFNPKKLGKKK
jgi:hypothetical protein